jgi:mRNA-degrading endonuclease YafQ of YafQ-DinJ toxin-antitoxin module
LRGILLESETFTLKETKAYRKGLPAYISKVKEASKKLEDIFKYLRVGQMPPRELNRPHKIEKGKRWSHIPGDIWDIHIGSANSDWILLINRDEANKIINLLAIGTHSKLANLL